MTTEPLDERTDIGRKRIRQIFSFLKAFNELRNPQVRQVDEHPWVMWLSELPQHPLLWFRGHPLPASSPDSDDGSLLLRVRRPEIPVAPAPPGVLQGWIPETWKNPTVESVQPIPERLMPGAGGSRVIERFEVSRDRVRAFDEWGMERKAWAEEARLAHKILAAFNQLYELKGRLEREGESVQLLLGEGLLVWRRDEGDIRHPVLTQKLQLVFDAYLPEFRVVETDHPPELITSLLATDQPVAPATVQQIREELAVVDLDLLDADKTEGPLRRLAAALDAAGRYAGKQTPRSAAEYPQIASDPVFYLSRRTQGFAASLESILEDLREKTDFPSGLMRVTGIDSPISGGPTPTRRQPWDEPEEILFTKEANEEQIRIADRLARHGSVLVQGPPGTGKTHTIANLIGHLLAHGKRVLVTAHTSKALRVLREKVVEPLQTLCVSVLDSETESRKELEASVDSMVARLTSDDPDELDREAVRVHEERQRLISTLSRLRRSLIDGRQNEYRDVIIGGIGTSPSVAARFLSETEVRNAWIPGPLAAGAPAPLSDEQTAELFSTNTHLDPDAETELKRWRPLPGEVPGAEEFGTESMRWRALQEADTSTGSQLWGDCSYEATEEELLRIGDRIQQTVELLADAQLWKLDAIAAGISERGPAIEPWTELIGRIEKVRDQAQNSLGSLLDHRCEIEPVLPLPHLLACSKEIREFVEAGGELTRLRLMTRPTWRKLLGAARTNGHEPRTSSELAAIETFLTLREAREVLGQRWDNQIARRGGPRWEEFGIRPEESTSLFNSQISALLEWQTKQLSPLLRELGRAGFDWGSFINSQEVPSGEHAELQRLVNAVVHVLPDIVAARINQIARTNLDRKFRRWNSALFSPDPNTLPASPVLDLRKAVSQKDYAAYDEAYRRLARLHSLAPAFDLRRLLISRVRLVAPRWADVVEQRIAPHDGGAPPGSAAAAWKWRQLKQELDLRAEVSLPELQAQIEREQEELRRATSRLIELQSWAAQCRRVGLQERQALQGWKDIVRRIGRGTGKRAPGLRVEARRTLANARKAVPVWIMPLSRVAETFDPREARFDVVIVDEASQCDLMGLIAFYLAKEIVVVGDHQQVSPLAVGQEISEVVNLIEQHLSGIPNSKLYDGRMSLYDLARQSFGGVIRLLEHFRCVPEIISFSNDLSYDGEIQPLRDPSGVATIPFVVPFRVSGSRGEGKVNREEARAIASLLQACLEQPEYDQKTFGAVSLLGEEQAFEIERLVRQTSAPGRLEAARFLCGIAAQFQGDERDVAFLSMVDSPSDGPLPMRAIDMYRQRFNVAASRAKDQLWVVHSLDPARDLQPGDLRMRLIEHAQHPQAILQRQSAAERRTESEFEKLVLRRLVSAGFRVQPQWRIANYRVDLLVEGSGKKLAVECDGDRFHPLEQLAADMARQAVLERMGLRFVRIRGSQFFRDPDGAMQPVFEALRKAGISPAGVQESPPRAAASSDLLDRVTRRAAEILRAKDDELPQESSPVSTGLQFSPRPVR